MKKVFFTLAFGSIMLVSCKKKYECLCYDIYGNETVEMKKGKSAEDACGSDGLTALSLSYCEPA
jgi:hypothetical protein